MLWRHWFQTASPILQTTTPTTTVTMAQNACSHHASSLLPLVPLPHRILSTLPPITRHIYSGRMADSTASPSLNSPPPALLHTNCPCYYPS
ncbi:hypothetical protein BDR07DRAFT_1394576 [Suillus spraguei]|nr:hypothetical protein BDR07DRAFT_1394576 [Suillus spraguei]